MISSDGYVLVELRVFLSSLDGGRREEDRKLKQRGGRRNNNEKETDRVVLRALETFKGA